MKRFKENVMATDFKIFFKRLFAIAMLVVVAGGAFSAFTYRTQIQEGIAYHQTNAVLEGKDQKEEKSWELADQVFTEPTTGQKAELGIYVGACAVLLVTYWVSLAAWIYQRATRSNFFPMVWFILVLLSNAVGAGVYFITQSVFLIKCPHCGSYQSKKNRYCKECGELLIHTCDHCGAVYEPNQNYCVNCGKKLEGNV